MTDAPPSTPSPSVAKASEAASGGGSRVARGLVEWVAIIAAALVAAFLIKTFLIQAFYIPSSSMEHTLEIGDRVLVNKLSYRFGDVDRGDIVVFERDESQLEHAAIKDLIKRVVGLPGDTVEGRNGEVWVNGKPLAEDYLEDGVVTGPFKAVRIPPDSYWVMGDNRGNSADSRVFGAIDEDQIVGRAFVRVWPLPSFGFF